MNIFFESFCTDSIFSSIFKHFFLSTFYNKGVIHNSKSKIDWNLTVNISSKNTKSISTTANSSSQTHSTIVDRFLCQPIVTKEEMSTHIKTYGKFQSYPDGILNPLFCGMTLWELSPDHIFNDYKVCEFHQIKCGIIMYGNMVYVFTPIENNDIKSHLKILFWNKRLKYDMSHMMGTSFL